MELWQLRQRQSLPLEVKIVMSQQRIIQWYEAWGGDVYVSFSGGKDSTVLLHLVRQLYPNVPAVFVDTGLEYPEIREFVKSVDNVEWLKPKLNFKQVVDKYGYPVAGKEVSRAIYYARKGSGWALKKLRGDGFLGMKKWNGLCNSDINISDECCYIMKKQPLKKYERVSGEKPFIGVMAGESRLRQTKYLRKGCNAFEQKNPQSNPLAFWSEQDIWNYINTYKIPYSKIYDMGYTRTGCMFCMFGVHMEETPNRFERMRHTHPKQWEYCMNKLGLAKVLDYIGVPWGGQMELEDYIV